MSRLNSLRMNRISGRLVQNNAMQGARILRMRRTHSAPQGRSI